PRTTFTVLSQPPDFGNPFSHSGNTANSAKGTAKANEYATIPRMGFITSPPADNTRTLPTIGMVHENDTSTSVADIKKMPASPPLSAARSALFTHVYGALMTNKQRKERAKAIKMKNTSKLGSQCVARAFKPSAPNASANAVPAMV